MSKKNDIPPQVIPESSVISLAAWRDKSKISNSNWENSLNVPITVNPGDSIFVKASFIDTRGTASGNIDLAVDTEISLEYYFYWIHTFSACNKSELISDPTQPDASNNLNQQVLVGPDIETLFAYNQAFDPSANAVPAYLCDPSGVFQATDINDADGLPYLVYESINNFFVPPVVGPVIPASEIVAGTSYVVHTAGLSTNWQYAGVLGASKNILPSRYDFDVEAFLATNNPNGVTVPPASPLVTNPGMSPSAFLLPADVQPTLPYVSYMITDVGDTQWSVIDPTFPIPAPIYVYDMAPGSKYTIETIGDIDFTQFGAANNNIGTTFICVVPPPIPPEMPINLPNSFFLDTSGVKFSFGSNPYVFGTDPNDTFTCVLNLNATNQVEITSFFGSGTWCQIIFELMETPAIPSIVFPSIAINFSAATTGIKNPEFIMIAKDASQNTMPIDVSGCIPGVKYTIATAGGIDGSSPVFLWNMIGNFPTADTSTMVAGQTYQVVEDVSGVIIPGAPNGGRLGDVFVSQGPIIPGILPPPTPIPSLNFFSYASGGTPPTPNIFTVVTITLDGTPYPLDSTNYESTIIVTADAQGNCVIVPGNSNIGSFHVDFLKGVDTVITTINGQDQPGNPPINVSFISTRANGDFGVQDEDTIYNFVQYVPLVSYPPGQITIPYSTISTPPTPNIYTVVTCDLDGVAFPLDNSYQIVLNVKPDGSGNCFIGPDDIGNSTIPWLTGVSTVITTINGSAQAGYESINVSFISTAANGDFSNDFGIGNFRQNAPLVPFPTLPAPNPSKLVLITPGAATNTFTCTGTYTGTGSTSTVLDETYYLSSVTVDQGLTIEGQYVYIPGTVTTGILPGAIIKSLFADPAPPSTGRAVLYPTPYIPYDGTVREVLTPAFNKVKSRPVKKKWSMVLKAGSYNPNYLAELISRNMSRQKQKRVNNILNGPFGTQSSLTVPTDSIYNNQSGSNVFTQPISGGANVFYDSKNPAAYDVVPDPNYNLPPDNEDDMPFLYTPAMNSSTLFVNTTANPTAAQNNFIYAEVPHPNANRLNNLPNPTWYVNLVPLISDVRSISPTIQGTGTPYYTILPFYTQNAVVQGGGSVEGNSGVFPIVFGANQTSLLYNNENNGLFSFNYLHSPMYAFLSSGTSDLTEVTAHMYTTAKTGSNVTGTNFFTTLVDKNSGILLNQMNPPGFWQQLGFRIEDLTVDLDGPQIGYQMKLADFQKKTTGGFCGSSNIFNPVFHTNNSALQPSCPDTELVFATATPAATPPSAIITAFTGNLTIGSVYRIYYPGQVKSVAGRDFIIFFENDWTPVGGPLGPVDSNLAGTVFTATSTGFDPNNPPDYSGGDDAEWTIAPTVVLADFPESTTTVLQSTYFQVENTNTLDAGNIPTVRDATGHYLVELTGYNSNYIDDQSKREIKAIVSSYWVSPGAFVSVPFPDSYNFYGTGAPQTLSTIKTRILDPFTDQEAILGPNSSIYLQVNRMLSQAAEEQIN